jgi:hypothetical protein
LPWRGKTYWNLGTIFIILGFLKKIPLNFYRCNLLLTRLKLTGKSGAR